MVEASGVALNDALLDDTRRLRAPKDLDPQERALWETTVYSRPAAWFGIEHAQMLREYVRAGALAEKLGCESDEYVKKHRGALTDEVHARALTRIQRLRSEHLRIFTSLARAMRLTHQSRYRAEGARPQRAGTVFEERGGDKTKKVNGKTPGTARPWDR